MLGISHSLKCLCPGYPAPRTGFCSFCPPAVVQCPHGCWQAIHRRGQITLQAHWPCGRGLNVPYWPNIHVTSVGGGVRKATPRLYQPFQITHTSCRQHLSLITPPVPALCMTSTMDVIVLSVSRKSLLLGSCLSY